MMEPKKKRIAEYNSVFREYDKIYRDTIKVLGLNDSSFWILYTIRDGGEGITQSEIVNMNFLPPQTINSELKKLEKSGFVQLLAGTDKRKKQVYLTAKGKELSARTADKIIAAEMNAMDFLSEQEMAEFLRLFRKYISCLGNQLEKLKLENNSNE